MITTAKAPHMTQIASWSTFLVALDDYITTYGHTRIAQEATTDLDGQDYPLGRDVNLVRRQYAEGTLAARHVTQLERRPEWRWDTRWTARLNRWDATAEEIATHVNEHGTRSLSPRLTEWLRRQRLAHHQGQLTDAQSERLSSIPGALQDTAGNPVLPTKQVGRPSQVDQFISAARKWLADNPDKTLEDVTTATRVAIEDGAPIPLYKRIVYYRYRRDGREGSRPLSTEDAQRLEQLPGWSWTGPRRSSSSRS